MMLKSLVMSLAAISALAVHGQEIATCRGPAGRAFFHFEGLTDKAGSGWTEDKISKGVFSISRTGANEYDILYIDIQNKPISTKQEGGIVRLIRRGKTNLTFLVFYPMVTTEIYSLFTEKDGRSPFSLMQNKTGEGAVFPKSSVMVGDCDPIRFDVQ